LARRGGRLAWEAVDWCCGRIAGRGGVGETVLGDDEDVGDDVGEAVGDDVGEMVGEAVGEAVGDVVGKSVGDDVGEAEGEAVVRRPTAPRPR
jgi:hypothetical protein